MRTREIYRRISMKLSNIAFNNLRRRKAKAVFLIMGLMIGVASIVVMITAMQAMEEDIAHKMDEYGANILITPKMEGLSLKVGPAPGDKCERCWVRDTSVGSDANHPTACTRCIEAIT